MLNSAEGINGPTERSRTMARKRYQRGSVVLRGKHVKQWVGRYLADEVVDGVVTRVHKSVVLGTRDELPTRNLALRALEPHLAKVNSAEYRPEQVITFEKFVEKWKETQKGQYKPSTWSDRCSSLKCYLLPAFGMLRFSELTRERIQQYITTVPIRRARNVVMTLRAVWRVAEEWGYVQELRTIRWPKYEAKIARFFTVEEIQRIIEASEEPYKTMYWVAAETGIRAGELFALKYSDVDVEHGLLAVSSSVWNGQVGTPKTGAGRRGFAISPLLAARIKAMAEFHVPEHYLFATSAGTPFQLNNVLNRHLHPLLMRLEIPRGGFHAFRHANATMMDQLHAPSAVKKGRLGHSSLLVTKRYEHMVSEDDRRVSAELANLLTQPRAQVSGNDGKAGRQGNKGSLPKLAQAANAA